jgi:hypothetical protein
MWWVGRTLLHPRSRHFYGRSNPFLTKLDLNEDISGLVTILRKDRLIYGKNRYHVPLTSTQLVFPSLHVLGYEIFVEFLVVRSYGKT